MPTSTEEGQNMRAWVLYHSLTSLDNFLMWELATLQYDAITVCFPSRDPSQPNSLVSLKPNSIWHLIMLRKYIHHLVQVSHLSLASDASDHVLEPANFLHTNSCAGNSIRSPPHHLHLPLLSLHLAPELFLPLPLAPVNS